MFLFGPLLIPAEPGYIIAHMLIFAIETSCDETALALLETKPPVAGGLPRFKILKEAVASQIEAHRPFGGVVPMLAKREHQKNLPILYRKIFGAGKKEEGLWRKVDLMAVTVGPGLEPALWAGITWAEELAQARQKPLLGANHLEGHLYSFLLPSSKFQVPSSKNLFPAIALIVSGGHTILLHLKDLKTWKKLGETRDDAVGEAFDKVARLLRLPYPGGPEIEKLALSLPKGWRDTINFPRPMLRPSPPDGGYDFSFSGLKTAVLYYLRDNPLTANSSKLQAEVARAFSNAAIDVLVQKTLRAAESAKARSILLSGGVAANRSLRATLQKETKKRGLRFMVAEKKYNTDNAVMIAAAAYLQYLRAPVRNRLKHPLKANGSLGI